MLKYILRNMPIAGSDAVHGAVSFSTTREMQTAAAPLAAKPKMGRGILVADFRDVEGRREQCLSGLGADMTTEYGGFTRANSPASTSLFCFAGESVSASPRMRESSNDWQLLISSVCLGGLWS